MLETLGCDFDFISCDQVLHHTPDPVATLRIFADLMLTGATLHFFVCRKKNEYRDFVDDTIMHHARNVSAPRLWQFAETVTKLGKEIHELHTGEFIILVYLNMRILFTIRCLDAGIVQTFPLN